MFYLPSWRGRQWQTGIICLALSMFVAACGTSSSTSSSGSTSRSSSGACTTGNVIVNGISTEKFCGTAKAQATLQGQPYTWTQGVCFHDPNGVGVNIGQEVLDASNSAAGNALRKQYDYFAALAQASKDGTYPAFVVGYYHGLDISAKGSVTFSNNLQAGSFTGQTTVDNSAITASWTCA